MVICYLALEEYTEKLLKRHLKEDKGNKLVLSGVRRNVIIRAILTVI